MMLKGITCLMIAVFFSSYSVAKPLSKEAGWQFTLSLNAGYSGGKSQFDTDHENEINNDLNNSGQSRSSALVYPLGRGQYTLDNLKTQFFLGNSRDQISTAQFQYELGIVHQFSDDSKLTVAVFPKLSILNETWADPFLVGSKRQTTDQSAGGGRIAIEKLFGSPLTLKYAIASSSIDDELSGQSQLTDSTEIASLQRDSLYQRVEIETLFAMEKGLFLKPNLQFTNRNADGDANSYQQYSAQLSLLIFQDRHTFVTTINAGVRHYKQINPIFNDKQDLQQVGVFSIYTYKKPFNWQRWSWTMMAGYNQEKSDVTFYDSNRFIVSTGMVYEF